MKSLLVIFSILLLTSTSTALEYRIIYEDVTEWVTVSRTIPENTHPMVMRIDTCNQVGTQYKVTIALIDWMGEVKRFELERIAIIGEKLGRSTQCSSQWKIGPSIHFNTWD